MCECTVAGREILVLKDTDLVSPILEEYRLV